MLAILRLLLPALAIVCLPYASMAACDAHVYVEKKPVGLRKAVAGKGGIRKLTPQDRVLWKSVLHWCDECDERASFVIGQGFGGVAVYPLNKTQYIVAVECESMQPSELILYKITDHGDTIESRLLPLEQFSFVSNGYSPYDGPGTVYDEFGDKEGHFIRFTDPLIYGTDVYSEKKRNHLTIEKRFQGSGGCGLLTIYNVSGDCPKVVEFRGKIHCSAKYVPPHKWKRYPLEVRATWPTAPNPLREYWKNKDQCR